MKLVQFWKNNAPALGIQTEQGIIDVAAEAARRGISAPATMLEAIKGGEEAKTVLSALSENAECFTDAKAAPAVTGMDKVICIGLNYRKHAVECNLPIPQYPVVFTKFPSTLSAHEDEIALLPEYTEYD